MLSPHRFCLAGLALLLLGRALAEEPLLTDAEAAGLERENAMWRLTNPEQGVSANVARLKEAGYTAEEIAAVQPQMAAIWAVAHERNFGWLRPETVEQIRAIDREFIARMRATQVYERTGVQLGTNFRESAGNLNRQWRIAILHALDNGELAEFQLMNSTASRQESRLTRDLALTLDEQRTLFEWRRDYDGRHGVSLGAESGLSDWQRESRLDQCRRIRDLLGDTRFAIYLSRVNPGFERMRAVLAGMGETNPATTLDLWWLRQTEGMGISRATGLSFQDRSARMARLRGRAAELMGGERVSAYAAEEDGRWLSDTPRRRVVRKAQTENLTTP